MAERIPQSFDYASAKALGFSDEQVATMAASAANYDLSNALQAGYDYSQILNLLDFQMPQTGGTITPEPPPVPVEPPVEGDSFLRQVADVPLSVATGVSQGIRMLTDAFGADNPVSRQLSGLEDTFASLLSAQAKDDREEIARILAEVEDMGMGAQLRGALRAFMQAPLTLTSQAFGTIVPVYVTGLATTAAKLGAAGTRAAVYGTAITQGVGLTKDAIYETVSSELTNAGVPEEAAAEAAREAQGYLSGGNLDMIALGGVLGAVALRFGAETALLPNVFKKLNPKLTTEAAEQLARQSMPRKVAATAVKEAIPEAFQGTGEQLARNLALRGLEQADLDRLGLTAAQIAELASTPVGRGLVAQGALEGMVGVPVGALSGYIRARRDAIERGASSQELRTLKESIGDPQIAAFVEETQRALEDQYAGQGMPPQEIEKLVQANLNTALMEEFNRLYGDTQTQMEDAAEEKSELDADAQEYGRTAGEPLRIDEGEPHPADLEEENKLEEGAKAGRKFLEGQRLRQTELNLSVEVTQAEMMGAAQAFSDDRQFIQGFIGALDEDIVADEEKAPTFIESKLEELRTSKVTATARQLGMAEGVSDIDAYIRGFVDGETLAGDVPFMERVGREKEAGTFNESWESGFLTGIDYEEGTPEGVTPEETGSQAVKLHITGRKRAQLREALKEVATEAAEASPLIESGNEIGAFREGFLEGYADTPVAAAILQEVETKPGSWSVGWVEGVKAGKAYTGPEEVAPEVRTREDNIDFAVRELGSKYDRMNRVSDERNPYKEGTKPASIWAMGFSRAKFWSTADPFADWRGRPENLTATQQKQLDKGFQAGLDFYAEYGESYRQEESWESPTTAGTQIPPADEMSPSILYTDAKMGNAPTKLQKWGTTLFGMRKSNRLLAADSGLAGRDISDPVEAGFVRYELEKVKDNRDTTPETKEKIEAYLERPEFADAVTYETGRDESDFVYSRDDLSRNIAVTRSNRARALEPAKKLLDNYQTETNDILKDSGFASEEELEAYKADTEANYEEKINAIADQYLADNVGINVEPSEAKKIAGDQVKAELANVEDVKGKLQTLQNRLLGYLAKVQDITVNPLFDLKGVQGSPFYGEQAKKSVNVERAQELLADNRIEEIAGITPDMIEEAHKRLTKTDTQNLKALPTSTETDSTYNPVFEETATGTAALNEIIKNGNPFEQVLARLLRPFLSKTKIKIVSDPAVDIETQTLREEFGKGIAMYASSTDTIYLGPEAVNNTGVLHEGVHGATAAIITSYIQNPLSVSEEARLAVKELMGLNEAASEQYYRLKKANKSNPVLDILADEAQGNIFNNSVEFLAYGQTQEAVQDLLLQTPATLNWQLNVIRNGESQFVNIIRRMLKIPMKHYTGMEQLLDLTDRLAISQAETKPQVSVIAHAKKGGRRLRKLQKTQAEQDTLRKFSEESLPINEVMTNRNGDKAVDFIDSIWEGLTGNALSKVVYTFTNTMLNRQLTKRNAHAGEKADQIEVVHDFITKYKSDALKPLEQEVTRWQKFNLAFQNGSALLADLIHISSIEDVLIVDIDGSVTGTPGTLVSLPTSINTDPIITKARQKRHQQKFMGESTRKVDNEIRDREDVIKQVFAMKEILRKAENGGQEGVEIYKAVMTKYYDDFVAYHEELVKQIGDAPLRSDQKEKLLAEIQLLYEETKKLRVYAPLMRYGIHGLRVRKPPTRSGQQGETLAFFLFESRSARNRFEKAYKRDNPDVVTDRETATDLRKGIKKDINDSSAQLEKINKMLEQLEAGNLDVEAVKEQAYQMYLRGLPQGNIRRKFLHRRNIPGYSNNALQNYVNTQLSTINQMARLKYSTDINNRSGELDAILTPDIVRNPAELERQRILAREIQQRAIDAVYTPMPEGGVERTLDWLTRQGSKSVFYYMLSSVRSAVIQPSQLLQFGYPTLAGEYGRAKTIKVMGEYLKVGNKFGRTKRGTNDEILDEKGQLIIRESNYVQNHPDKERFMAAWDWANDRDLFGSTRVSSILEAQSEDIMPPGSESLWGAESPGITGSIARHAPRATKFVFKSLSFMFHHMERMSREVMYMSTFELAWERAKNKHPNTQEGRDAAFKEAAQEAVKFTHEGMFNYSQYNKPSAAKRWYGRLPYQFMSYRLQATAFMWRSFYDGLLNSDLSREESRKALGKFLDVMGISVFLSGVTGMFGYTATVALIDGLREVMRPDFDDDDRDLFYDEDDQGNVIGKRSFDLYIRNNIIPRYFGAKSGMAQLFGISPEVAEWVTEIAEYGALSALTQSNWSVSTSLDGMWFKSTKPEDSYEGFLANTMYDLTLGPFASLTKNVAKGMEIMVEDGDILRGAEYMLPGMIKEPMEAARLWREGFVTLDGREVTPAEYYQGWRVVGQALGFNNLDVQRSQDSTFLVKDMVRQGEELYASLLEDHSEATLSLIETLEETDYNFNSRKVRRKENALQEVREEIAAYNWKYFYDPISDESLERSYEGRLERAGMTVEGLYLPDDMVPYFYPMIAPSRLEPLPLIIED